MIGLLVLLVVLVLVVVLLKYLCDTLGVDSRLTGVILVCVVLLFLLGYLGGYGGTVPRFR